MSKVRFRIAVVVCSLVATTAVGHADAITDWNAIAVPVIGAAGPLRPGGTASLDFATIHVAMYDAVEAIDGRFCPYHVEIPGAHGSTAAAAAKAAHDVLVNRFPDQLAFLDQTYHDYLLNHQILEDDPGVAVGEAAAAGIIAFRANDGSFPANYPPFVGAEERGIWRPTPSYIGNPPGPPPPFAPMAAPWLGTVTPFTLNSPTQFRPGPPPTLRSHRYTRDYKEVKALGSSSNSERTPEQTELAYFWALNFVAVLQQTLRDVADAQHLDIDESARLFALVTMAMADGAITVWNAKRHYVQWRPVTAIQEGNHDGNPRTHGDPNWQPFLNTPNYPDYISGATCLTTALMRTLALFFRTDHMTFSITTTNPLATQQTRTYSRFSDVAKEVLDARVYHGAHFRTSDTVAYKVGRRVAKWAFKHFLRPVDDDDDDDDDDREDDDDDDGGRADRDL
jgi:hypothetical protein